MDLFKCCSSSVEPCEMEREKGGQECEEASHMLFFVCVLPAVCCPDVSVPDPKG